MNMGFFYAPYTTDDDATVSQDVYLAANFDIDTFLIKIYVADNDGYVTGVTIRDDDVSYTEQSDTVTLYSTSGYCDTDRRTFFQFLVVVDEIDLRLTPDEIDHSLNGGVADRDVQPALLSKGDTGHDQPQPEANQDPETSPFNYPPSV